MVVPAATCVPAAGVTFVSAIDADLGRPTVVITPGGEAGGRTEHGNGGRTRRGDRGVGEYQPLTARARRLRLRRGIPAGFLYLAVVLDAYSRRIVGWSMATTLATRLVLDALDMALLTRRPQGVIHHSDQGSQLGFNQSSQRSCALTVSACQMPLQVFSSQGFCEASC